MRIYTRNLNEVGDAIPEVVELVAALPAQEMILDGETLAFDASNRPRPFQVTMRRFGRKLDVERMRAELPIRAFFFDCLRYGGESLADRPARDRFRALAEAVPESLRIPQLITASVAEAQAFYDSAIAAGHEGVMAKSLDSPYEAGNRGASWLKIKRVHTLDLVVLAAEWGHGRRTGKLSNLHLGALDPDTGEYVMLGKTFKGLTDAMLEWQTKEFLAREVSRDERAVYVRPELVVEIAFSDLQASTRYPGGLALRLARVKRYRDDKTAEEADTMASVRSIYEAQGAGNQRYRSASTCLWVSTMSLAAALCRNASTSASVDGIPGGCGIPSWRIFLEEMTTSFLRPAAVRLYTIFMRRIGLDRASGRYRAKAEKSPRRVLRG